MNRRSVRFASLGLALAAAGCSLPGSIIVDDAADVTTVDASDATDIGIDGRDAADVASDVRDIVDTAADAFDVTDTGVDTLDARDTSAPDVVDAVDVGPADTSSSTVVAPRLIAPPSASIQTNNVVTLEWQLPSGTTGAVVELCRTRACASPTAVTVPGPATTVTLTPGQVHAAWNYWRVRGTASGLVSSTPSPTWQFYVPSSTTAPRSGHYGAVLDWNGDGIPDLAVGLSNAVALYTGTASGYADPPTATLTLSGTSGFGAFVGSAGDVDGNGFADLVVIAQGSSSGLGHDATALVYHSDGTGYPSAPDRLDIVGSNTVHSVSWAGDVNHDGYADVVIGAVIGPALDHDSGEFYVILGSGAPITSAMMFRNEASGFVVGVSGAGDVNGDGFDDFAMSTGTYSSSFGPSAAYIFAGGTTLSGTPSATIPEPGNEHFDGSVSAGCDFNQDGWPDVAFGVYSAAAGGSTGVERYHDAGASTFATMYLDSALGYSGNVGAISCTGDVSGDGDDDLIFSLPSSTSGGATFHVLSAAHATATSANFSAVILGANLGDALSVIGDYDGDGLADLAIGGGVGNVAIVRGTASSPFLDTSPASIETVSNSDGSFGASLAFRHSAIGRSWALRQPWRPLDRIL